MNISRFLNNKKEKEVEVPRKRRYFTIVKSQFLFGQGWELISYVILRKQDGKYIFYLHGDRYIEVTKEEAEKYDIWAKLWFLVEYNVYKMALEQVQSKYNDKFSRYDMEFIDINKAVAKGERGYYLIQYNFEEDRGEYYLYKIPEYVVVRKISEEEAKKLLEPSIEYINL